MTRAAMKESDETRNDGRASWMQTRFRGFLPVVVDVETGGFNEHTDALLELAAVIIGADDDDRLFPEKTVHFHVEPFAGANMEEAAMKINRIDPFHPLRLAQPEARVLAVLFDEVGAALARYRCTRAILTGHNAFFDLKFLRAAVARNRVKDNPFHRFSSLDTVTLGALAYRHTVLSKIAERAGFGWDETQAHSALYDAETTAQIFCHVCNAYRRRA